jgi:hypothetical protein
VSSDAAWYIFRPAEKDVSRLSKTQSSAIVGIKSNGSLTSKAAPGRPEMSRVNRQAWKLALLATTSGRIKLNQASSGRENGPDPGKIKATALIFHPGESSQIKVNQGRSSLLKYGTDGAMMSWLRFERRSRVRTRRRERPPHFS